MSAADARPARAFNAAFQAFEKAGRPVKAVRFYADGSYALLTEVGGESLPEADIETSWVEAAGEATRRRA